MKIDDSFKKPGSVPFKWEIRPGVPKLQNPKPPPPDHSGWSGKQRKQKKQSPVRCHSPETPRKLKPPPAGLYYQPQLEPRTRSFSRGPEVVQSAGCFPTPLGKLKKTGYPRSKPGPEYCLDLERWSVSSRRSVSPLPASFASRQSSPRPVSDADWAGFGLF